MRTPNTILMLCLFPLTEKIDLCFMSNSAKVLYVKGRQHPVTIYHTSTGQTDYVDTALRTFFQIHVDQPPGDVLVFLPGELFLFRQHMPSADVIGRPRGH